MAPLIRTRAGSSDDTATTIDYGATNAPAYIGRYATNYFNGGIAAVAVHNRALAPSEIQQLYADPFDGQGWCLLRSGSRRGATDKFEKALSIAPGYASSLNGLAELDGETNEEKD